MHPNLHFKFWWHYKLVSLNRIEDSRLVRVLLLIHLLLHHLLLLRYHIRVHSHHVRVHLHLLLLLLLHLLIVHHLLLLVIHVLGGSLVFLLLHLLLIHVLLRGLGHWHWLLLCRGDLFLLLSAICGTSCVLGCWSVGTILLLRHLIWLCISHI